MVDFIADYFKTMDSRRVSPDVSPGWLKPLLPTAAPEEPEEFSAVLRDVEQHILPGVLNWQHPRFFGFFPANTSPPALLADMLSNATGAIGFSWVASPAATELETIVLDWSVVNSRACFVVVVVPPPPPPPPVSALRIINMFGSLSDRLGQLLGLSESFSSSGSGGGVIQCTASDSAVVALLAAKQMAIAKLPVEEHEAAASKFVWSVCPWLRAPVSAKAALAPTLASVFIGWITHTARCLT
jgi:aromatic-L-amino-acid decarboxylase